MAKSSRQIELNNYRCKGAFVTLEQLLEQRFCAQQLALPVSKRSRVGMSGLHISKQKGRGVDFEEHRPYQAGDDIRSIDWRVTARSGRPYTKIFREERERPILLAIDLCASMYFGSRTSFKSVVAAESAALLAWHTVEQGDRVGGVVFNDIQEALVRPRRSKRSALRLLNDVADYSQHLLHQHRINNQPERMRSALLQLSRITKPGSSIYLISDFSSYDASCMPLLQQLARHSTLHCLMIYDALEAELPQPDLYSITNGDERTAIDTHNRAVRLAWQNNFSDRLQQLRNELILAKVNLVTLRTDQSLREQQELWKQIAHSQN
jgi:uncharacterized protein (DUF58 family)